MGRIFAGLILFSLFPVEVFAQVQISGKVIDKISGEGLPAAHIIIKGTLKGTIANEDGGFTLKVEEFPAVITARFIGFETKEITIDKDPGKALIFELEEAVISMEELTITDEDPAVSIMKEVIRRKKIWQAGLNTYAAEAYGRVTLLSDTTIVTISEIISDIYWDRDRGPKEVLKSRRNTANLSEMDIVFSTFSDLPNFYDDWLEIAGFDVMGVTNEKALKNYHFRLKEFKSIDDKIVFEIEVSPKRKLQPLFEGTIFVLDEDYALLSVDLQPNQVVTFPPPIQDFGLAYKQQFNNFGGDYWLPVDVRMEGMIELGITGLRFPPIGYKQVSKISNYIVNTPLPDSLFGKYGILSVDSVSVSKSDSLFAVSNVEAIPLTKLEEKAYENIDSTATLGKAFKPKGFLTRFIDFDAEFSSDSERTASSADTAATAPRKSRNKFTRNFKPDLRFNKVELFHTGLKFDNSLSRNKVYTSAHLAYNFGYREWSHGLQISWRPLPKKSYVRINIGYDFDTVPVAQSDIYGMVLPGLMPLIGEEDYYNYFRKEGGFIDFDFRVPNIRAAFKLGYSYENDSSINFKSSYDIFARNNIQPFNLPVDEGYLSVLYLEISQGDTDNLFGVTGQQGYRFRLEQSSKGLGSSRNYTRFSVNLYKSMDTFLSRRLFSNTLDIRINAGSYLGDLPVQKYGVLDASFGYITPFGVFKTKRFIPYQGASYAGLYAEHNFRSVPFEMLGWRSAPKTGLGVILFGGAGKTWTPGENTNPFTFFGTDGIHLETGVSVNNIFSMFRIDFAFRLDKPGFYPGISVARVF